MSSPVSRTVVFFFSALWNPRCLCDGRLTQFVSQINPRAVAGRSVAPPSVMRMDDIAPHNWAHAHSPPSPVIHSAASQQAQQQAHFVTAATHIHHHHHHRHRHSAQPGPQRPQQQHQQEQQQSSYTAPPPPLRRAPSSSSNLGPPPPSSSAPLSSLLHPPPPEGSVKMEAQQSQTSLPPFKSTDAFSNFPSHPPQQQQRPSPYPMGHIQHSFGRPNSNEHQQHIPHRLEGRHSPNPGERMHRMKEELGQTTERMRGPFFRPGGGLGYS